MRQLLMISGLASILMTGVAAAPTFAQTAPPQGGQAGAATPATPSEAPGRPPVAGRIEGPGQAQGQGQGNGPRGPAQEQAHPGPGGSGLGGASFAGHGFEGRGPAGRGQFGHPPFPGAFPPPMRPGLPFEAAAGIALAGKLSAAETYVGVTPEQLGAWRAYTTALIDFAEPPEAGGRDRKADVERLPGEGMADGLIAAAEKAKALKGAIDGLKKALKPEQLHRLSEIAPTLAAFGPPPGPDGEHGGPDGPHEPHWPHGPRHGGFFGGPAGFPGGMRLLPPGPQPAGGDEPGQFDGQGDDVPGQPNPERG